MRHSALALTVLALALMLSLAACGDRTDEAAADTEPAVTETQPDSQGELEETDLQEADSQEDAELTAETSGSAGAMAALCDQLIGDNGVSDPILMDLSALSSVYGLQAGQVADAAGFTAMSGRALPEEVVLVQAVDEAAAGEIYGQLANHLKNIEETASANNYEPESAALALRCQVVSSGNYVALFFTEHYDDMVAAFQSAVG